MERMRIWCKTHNVPCVNVGNGRVLTPTDSDPTFNEEGWMEFNTSEFHCGFEDCNQDYEVQVQHILD